MSRTVPPQTPAQHARAYAIAAVRIAWRYAWLTGLSRRDRAVFDGVEQYVMFVGFPRSGHSILGAFLDAHPEAVVSHETAALQLIHAGFDRDRLYAAILADSAQQAATNRVSEDYSYAVPGQHQGRYRRLRVIGDKKGEGAGLRLRARPWLLDRLRERVGVPVRIVHGVRNPYDNIATMALRAVEATGRPLDLDAAIERYARLCETASGVQAALPAEAWLDHRHEDLIADPEAALRRVCDWLGLDAPDDYVAACAETVYASPNRSRHAVDWTDVQRGAVERLIERHLPLRDYVFDA